MSLYDVDSLSSVPSLSTAVLNAVINLSNSEPDDTESIKTTLSDAIKIARSLNTAIRSMCPDCLEIIRRALSQEEEAAAATTTNEKDQNKHSFTFQ
jgi:hypothetical protein